MPAGQVTHEAQRGRAAVRRLSLALVFASALILTMVAIPTGSAQIGSSCQSTPAAVAKTNSNAERQANKLLKSTSYTPATRTFTPRPSSTKRFTGYETIAVKSPEGTSPVVGYFTLTGNTRCGVVVTSARVALSRNAYLVALKFPGEQGKTGSLKVTLVSTRKANLGGTGPLATAPLPTNLIVNVASGSAGQQQLTVPAGVTSAVVLMQGGAGDKSRYGSDRVGAAITGTLSVTPGEVLTVGAASEANGGSGGWGPAGMSGGNGGGPGTPPYPPAGGGGGASAILDGSTPLIVAGGGGGNGAPGGTLQCTESGYNGFGGSGGAPGSANVNGTPCTQTGYTAPGGISGAMTTGAGGVGGVMPFNDEGGGGGGGGYLGGTGGGAGSGAGAILGAGNGGAGGGAGSSYVDPARVSAFAITSAATPGNGSVRIYWIGSTGWVPANGQTQAISAPAGATGVSFLAVGGGGGSTGGIGNAGHGGNGAQVVGSLAVTPGQTFQITAGNRGLGSTAGGGNGSPGGIGLNGYTGGAGGSGGGSSATGGGGGGAATIVQSNGTTLIVAGGGGGGSDNNGGAIEHGNGGAGGAKPDNGSKGFGTQGGGAGKGGYGPTGVGQTAQSDSYDFVGGGGGGGALGGSAGTPGGGDGFGTGGGGGAGSSIASSTLTNASITTAPSAEDGFVIITWTIS